MTLVPPFWTTISHRCDTSLTTVRLCSSDMRRLANNVEV